MLRIGLIAERPCRPVMPTKAALPQALPEIPPADRSGAPRRSLPR